MVGNLKETKMLEMPWADILRDFAIGVVAIGLMAAFCRFLIWVRSE